MRFKGRVWKDRRLWLIEVPILDAMTQGSTRKEAYEMIVDLIITMANKPEFKVSVVPGKSGTFEVTSDDSKTLVALLLRRQRIKNGLSLAEMAKRLGAKSRNSYARYEQGTSVPTVEKLDELLKTVSPHNDFVLVQAGSDLSTINE